MNLNLKKQSKFLSLVLRHDPDKIGLVLDDQGWADVDELLRLLNRHRKGMSRERLDEIVSTNDKQRFAFDETGQRIRASQGHSIEIDLALEPVEPPELLFHGTATCFLGPIRGEGLVSQSRQHVHLSLDEGTARAVGSRHGKPIILTIRAGEMARAGYLFYVSANGVWLTETVSPQYIDFPQ